MTLTLCPRWQRFVCYLEAESWLDVPGSGYLGDRLIYLLPGYYYYYQSKVLFTRIGSCFSHLEAASTSMFFTSCGLWLHVYTEPLTTAWRPLVAKENKSPAGW